MDLHSNTYDVPSMQSVQSISFMRDRQLPMQYVSPLNVADVVRGKGKGQCSLAPASSQDLPIRNRHRAVLGTLAQDCPSPTLVANHGYKAQTALLFTCSSGLNSEFFLLDRMPTHNNMPTRQNGFLLETLQTFN